MSNDGVATGRQHSAGLLHITSTRNTRVVDAAKLQRRKERERTGRFLVEGPNAVADAVADGIVETIYVCGDPSRWMDTGVEVVATDEHVLAKLSTSRSPQGVVAVARREPATLADVTGPVIAVLWEISDPGNLGTVIRTADNAGAGGVVLVGDACDPWNPKAARAGAGSLSHLPVVLAKDGAAALSELSERGYRLVGLDADGPMDVFDLEQSDDAVALVLGNEAHGLPESVVGLLDGVARVPTFGRAESLNLSAAAAVALFAAARGRHRTSR